MDYAYFLVDLKVSSDTGHSGGYTTATGGSQMEISVVTYLI